MRERTNSDDTGFNLVVYGGDGMAKETVGARVPDAIAEQVDRYADTHEISRTEAMGLFIRSALENPDAYREKRVYTVRIREPQGESDGEEEKRKPRGRKAGTVGGWRAELRAADRLPGEFEENTALTARLPKDVVRGIEHWAEKQGMDKSPAAEDLLQRGLWADPLPEENPDPIT